MRPVREVLITHRVKTRAPLSILRKASTYCQIVVCKGTEVYSIQVLESRAHVPEPWETEEEK